MPIINVTMGPTAKETKKALIEKLTAQAVETTQIPEKFFTVVISEKSHDSIGIGGKTVEELQCAKES